MSEQARSRRFVFAFVSLVIGGLLISAASIGISVALSRHADAEREADRKAADVLRECLTDARNTELEGLKIETRATTALLQWAIQNQGENADPAGAIRRYQSAVADAQDHYSEAHSAFEVC